jgi:hypothetical protein
VTVPGGRLRRTAADYETFVSGLCGKPPGPERDECARAIVNRLLAMYDAFGGTHPPGLVEYVTRLGTRTEEP